ncbi:MAG: hypothetical protein ACYSUL_13965 [Planctomycetota bacterium]|jgi:hypothetical protein
MTIKNYTKYLYNGVFLLLITMVWNIIFYEYLPETYSLENFRKNVPTIVLTGENIFRILTFGSTIFLLVGLRDKAQKIGLVLYIFGVVIYFASWAAQMFLPDSMWSHSLLGYTAPAFTSIVWLLGIGLLGKDLVIKRIPYNRIVFIGLSITFVVFHTAHAVIAYFNQY